jgi:hypothetical protein
VIPLHQSKKKTAARDFALAAVFWLAKTIIFFFRVRFAIPVSFCFVMGFKNFSFVDPNSD